LISSAKSSFPGYFYDNLTELIFGYGEAHTSSALGTQMISECDPGRDVIVSDCSRFAASGSVHDGQRLPLTGRLLSAGAPATNVHRVGDPTTWNALRIRL
jgi:hypothetical protein